jgi:hypothetical protein
MFTKSTATFDIRNRYRYDPANAKPSSPVLRNFPAARNPAELKRVGMLNFHENDVDRFFIPAAGNPIAARQRNGVRICPDPTV